MASHFRAESSGKVPKAFVLIQRKMQIYHSQNNIKGKKLIVLDYVQGKYIIRYVNDDGETIFEAVAEEELLAH